MWARSLRACPRQRSWRVPHDIPRVRRYNGNPEAPHTTYFQPPPQPPRRPRRILRTLLLSSSFFALGAFATTWFILPLEVEAALGLDEMSPEDLSDFMNAGYEEALARSAPPMTLDQVNRLLENRAAFTIGSNAIGHTCQVPSNMPCEDTWETLCYTLFNDPKRDWSEWSIFDGHAGSRTSNMLRAHLSSYVGAELWKAKCMDSPYVPNDQHITSIIKDAFLSFDREIIEEGAKFVASPNISRTEAVAAAAAAFSGSCALMAFFDPVRSVLRVANVGDSRAVLGRWDDDAQGYQANAMSVDHKGFNADEAARIHAEHPGEEVIDARTGRVLGIAVTRAFGDARWKWPAELTSRAHQFFWGPPPRPNGVVKTPPYLSAEPDVTETRVQTGAHPDFLILASDGLWDIMSSEQAVDCVQTWLASYSPLDFLEAGDRAQDAAGGNGSGSGSSSSGRGRRQLPLMGRSHFRTLNSFDEDDDIFYDEVENSLRWRVDPKYYVVEDVNCGVHLVKNALGGKRRDLLTSILSVQPPHSRSMRDDITVQVIFFGVDTEPLINK